MIKRSLLLLGVLSFAVACSSDPNKAANDAHDAELKSQRQQQQQASDNRSDVAQDQAEYNRKATSASATGTPDTTQKRVTADAKLDEAREVARVKAVERLEKADAKAAELKMIVNRAGGKATTQSRDALRTADNQRMAAKMSIDQLANASGENLKQAKDYADSQLDTYEAYVKRAGKEVDDFK